MPRREITLPEGFPFSRVMVDFLRNYRRRQAYWYVPKGRVVSDDNLRFWAKWLEVLGDPEDPIEEWDVGTQADMLDRLVREGYHDPYVESERLQDATALVRVNFKVMQTLGLVDYDYHDVPQPTPAGARLIADEPDEISETVSTQIAKYQYPNPNLSTSYSGEFRGLLPHLFLCQVLERSGWHLSMDEYRLFVNLANSQEDLDMVMRYVRTWRDLSPDDQQVVLDEARNVNGGRYTRIRQDSSYQLALFCYPPHLIADDVISAVDDKFVSNIVAEQEGSLKIREFETEAEWMAYYGDPEQRPDWFHYLVAEVEAAESSEEADEAVEEHIDKLSSKEQVEVRRRQVEKWIEDAYVENLDALEPGLKLVLDGRQYVTEIGRIDLLCRAANGEIVVVEIKAGEAEDSVFGQILRYMGWVRRNYEGGTADVRGMVLAGSFPEKALYSRIGLGIGWPDVKDRLKFKKHGMFPEDVR